jgi:hypothetical protein
MAENPPEHFPCLLARVGAHLQHVQGVDIRDYQLMMEENLRFRQSQQNYPLDEEVQSNQLKEEEHRLIQEKEALQSRRQATRDEIIDRKNRREKHRQFIDEHSQALQRVQLSLTDSQALWDAKISERNALENEVLGLQPQIVDKIKFNNDKEAYLRRRKVQLEAKEAVANFLQTILHQTSVRAREELLRFETDKQMGESSDFEAMGLKFLTPQSSTYREGEKFNPFLDEKPSPNQSLKVVHSEWDEETESMMVASSGGALKQVRMAPGGFQIHKRYQLEALPPIAAVTLNKGRSVVAVSRDSNVEIWNDGVKQTSEKLFGELRAIKKTKKTFLAVLKSNSWVALWDIKRLDKPVAQYVPDGKEWGWELMCAKEDDLYLSSDKMGIWRMSSREEKARLIFQSPVLQGATVIEDVSDWELLLANPNQFAVYLDIRKHEILKYVELRNSEASGGLSCITGRKESLALTKHSGKSLQIINTEGVPKVEQTFLLPEDPAVQVSWKKAVPDFVVTTFSGKLIPFGW